MEFVLPKRGFSLDKSTNFAPLIPCQKINTELAYFHKKSNISNRLIKNPKLRRLCHFLSAEKNLLALSASDEFFKALPAADLHIHGGALPTSDLAVKIAWQRSAESDRKLQGIFGSPERLKERLLNPQPGQLNDYLTLYHLVRDYLFTTLDDIRAICHEGALNAFFSGTTLLEVRTSIKSGRYGDPASRHIMADVDFMPEEEFEAMVEGFENAIRASNGYLHVYLIITFRRGDRVENIMNMLNEAIRIREHIRQKFGHDYIRGIDIAGSEFGEANKAKKLKGVFRRAKEEGFQLTAHSGEEIGVGEGGILHSLNHLEVDRIGHGTSLYLPTPLLDPATVHRVDGIIKNAFVRLLQLGVPLESCLTSNLICGAQITQGYRARPGQRPQELCKNMTSVREYPFEILMALGDCVASGKKNISPLISTDGIFTLNTTLAREYSLAASEFNLGVVESLYLSYQSIQHSFAPEEAKAEIIRQSWLPFARLFLGEQDESLILKTMNEAIENYRKLLRSRLGISNELVTQIREEVARVDDYLAKQTD